MSRPTFLCALAVYWVELVVLSVPAAAQTSITGLQTFETALVGRFARGPVDFPVWVGAAEFASLFASTNPAAWPAELQARQYFTNVNSQTYSGLRLHIVRISDNAPLAGGLTGDAGAFTGLQALQPLSNLRLLLAPELTLLPPSSLSNTLAAFRAFTEPRGIFLILDPPPSLPSVSAMIGWAGANLPADATSCAIYFPYLQVQIEGASLVVPASGAMAGYYALNDLDRAIWHSPANNYPLQATTTTTPVLSLADSDSLNNLNLNPIRVFGTNVLPWGARTLDRTDLNNRYIPVVRTRAWIKASIERWLAWAALQDNGAPLWSQLRASVESFLHELWIEGGLAGATPSEGYYVRCDATTTTAADIAAHRVNVVYGLALQRAAEFEITTLNVPTYDPGRTTPRPSLLCHGVLDSLYLAFPTEAGFTYRLELTTDVESNSWSPFASDINGDGAWWGTNSTPLLSGSRLFRVRIIPGR
jgi:phage tail sheath protein FI